MLRLRVVLSLAFALCALTFVAPTADAARLEVGTGFGCALTDAGTVKCWGSNQYGQLGNGTIGGWALVPVDVTGLSGVVDLATGAEQACAVLSDGTVKCWGDNSSSTLGQTAGALPYSATPVMVGGVTGASRVTVGGFGSACAIVSGGIVRCWGYNLGAALGIGSGANYVETPTAVVGIAGGATDVSHDGRHGCAVVAGTPSCWGYNDYKSIVNSATVSYNSAQVIAGVGAVATEIVSSTGNSCIVTTVGAVRCWGRGDAGRLGNGADSDQPPPGVISITGGASQLSAGNGHMCALVGDSARCWGFNYYGQVGDPAANYSYNTPITPAGLGSGVTSIDAGNNNTCALQNGAAKCWGEYGDGVLGNGQSDGSATPIQVPGIDGGASSVATGGFHSCAVVVTLLKCWGSNNAKQLGNDSTLPGWQPVNSTVINLVGLLSQVAVSAETTCTRLSISVNQTFRCVGSAYRGQLGDGNGEATTAGTVTNPGGFATGAESIAAGSRTLCEIRSAVLYCWGENYNSLLGQNITYATKNYDSTPISPTAMTSGMTSVALSANHACAVKSGAVNCWGINSFGEVTGVAGMTVNFPSANGLTGVTSGSKAVAASEYSTCAIINLATDVVRCIGRGLDGELGNGANANSGTPVTVSGVSNPTRLAAADSTFCALADNAVKCWGANSRGELGNGTFTGSNVAVTVPGTTGATDIDGWADHFCAVVSGVVKCWGGGRYGVLGNKTAYGATTPVDANLLTAALTPPVTPPVRLPQKIKATLKQNGKAKVKRGKLNVPLKLYFKIPAGANSATVCSGTTTISVKISKKKTTKLKAKFKRKSPNCSYSGTIKLPKSFKRKKTKFTVSIPENADVLKYKSTKTLKLK